MAHRVRDVLLVSSDYDAFVLEEDGRLRDRLFVQYSELNLVTMPNLVHVSTPDEALQALQTRRFDLVLTTLRAEDPGVRGLSSVVKSMHPDLSTVLLVLDEIELKRLRSRPLPASLDRVFLWTGDTRILLAIIKLIEDSLNVAQDTRKTGVQVILVVEDSVRDYSSFLALLYGELMQQSQSLIAEGLNALHKLLRMRARPKIVLATSYEEAAQVYARYRSHVLAVLSDVQFPRQGQLDPEAGFQLARQFLSDRPDLPVLLLSASEGSRERAHKLGMELVAKNSPGMVRALQTFLRDNLGFGDFIFRLPDHTEVARASNMYELAQVLTTVDARSLHYHASREHFNVWLRARSMFGLADALATVKVKDFPDVEQLRLHILEAIHGAAAQEAVGVVTDFHELKTGAPRWFVRLGQGSLGGKGRGVAFLHSQVARHGLASAFEGLHVRVPRTLALATDAFDRFMEDCPPEAILRHPFPEPFLSELRSALKLFPGPLAVRSSSLLEDSQHLSCAGVYDTVFVANQDDDPERRLEALCRAIRQVYASTFSERAHEYMRGSPFSVQEEKMGVILQEMVGRRYGQRFYPHASGVAMSWNHYPMGAQRPQDGVAVLALGLGEQIVGGGRAIRFSPAHPGVLPHATSPRDFLRYAQHHFYALSLEDGQVRQFGLEASEQDGTLARVASVYCPDDDQFRENFRLAGPRVVTFNDILKWQSIPLAEALGRLLERIQQGMGAPVEIEFALMLDEHPCLSLLQVRPLAEVPVELGHVQAPGPLLARSPNAVGHGVVRELYDVVMVTDLNADHRRTPVLASQVAACNRRLEGRPYALIGPGRWGSSDPSLGIPVDIGQISGAALILELPFAGKAVEPSVGSHFFHDLVARRIGYLCFPTEARDGFLDWDWLLQQPAEEADSVRHVRLEAPLVAHLDGHHGRAEVYRSSPG